VMLAVLLFLVSVSGIKEGCWLPNGKSVESLQGCYTEIPCHYETLQAPPRSLQANRDILIDSLAKLRCTDSCTLWAALSQAERYIFLMNTAYFGDPKTSRLYPTNVYKNDTSLDHATTLYSINNAKAGQGVDKSGRGGFDYNRIYVGVDDFAKCVMRNFGPAQNKWVTSDDIAGPHTPFTQREMIYWYRAWYDLNSNGPQWHHWKKDSDFTASGIDKRLGVCGVTDRSVTEMTVAFDFYHNSDPLGDYSGRGGYGWQIVSKYVGVNASWGYMPSGCQYSAPLNTDPFGGGVFNGMGPNQANGNCVKPTYTFCS